MGLAGIPWWTTDMGVFHGGVNSDPAFRECLIRWFQFATFACAPHARRCEPHSKPLSTTGGGKCVSGAPNELWSFGEEAYTILEKYLRLRERLRPYTRGLMSAAHTSGSPIIRPLFYDFPADGQAWAVKMLHVRTGYTRRTRPVPEAVRSRRLPPDRRALGQPREWRGLRRRSNRQ